MQDTTAIKTLFDTVADRYDNPNMRYFPFAADRLVEHLRLRPGERVLDVATGTGHVALAAAQAIQPGGRVQAIDIAPRMLDRAFANLQRAGLTNVDFHEMDAMRLDFKSRYFDVVTCAFGLFFLPDMAAALREWQRVLKPGGRLMLATFTQNAFEPLSKHLYTALAEFGVVPDNGEAWRRLAEPATCETLLHEAGFEAVQFTTEQLGYHLNGPEDWWEIVQSSGYRGLLEQLDGVAVARLRQQHLADIQSLETDKGLWLDVETLFVGAQKPRDD